MQRLANFWARISFYLPSGKRTAFMVLWGSFVYFIVVPMYFVLQFYRDPKIDVKRLQFFDNDVNQAQVDVRANSLRMLGFVGVSAVIGLGTTKEKIKITLPCKKWSHLEPFNYRNNLEYIYLKETEGTVDEEVTNQLKLEANIVFHMFFMKFTYNYEKEVDLFNQNKGEKENEETVKVLSMSTKEEKRRLFIKALIELPLPSYLDISLKDLEISLCEDTSGKLCDFVINIESFTKTDLTLILDKQNIFALKRFLFKLDRKDCKSLGNARIFFTSTNNPYASDYHKSLIAILKTFVREIPNRHNQQKIESRNAQNRSVLFDFLSPTSEEKSNILVTKVKVHESLFPINLLAHLCKVIPFENIPVCGKLNEKIILNGSITQLSKFDEEYFALQINLEVLEGHKLFREFHSLDDKIFELKVIEDGSFASSIFSCISLFYNFKNAPVISSLPDLCMKPSNSLSKSKVLENNCLNIYTMASTNDNSFLITNEIYSSTFVEGPISLNFSNDFEFEFCTGLKLRSSKNEISIDPSRPLVNAFSLKEKFKLELEINQEFDLLSFVFFIQNKVESKNKNNKPLTFDDIIETLAFKVLRMYSMSKYELEISTTGKKIINPLIEWDLSIKKTIKINADLNRCENSHVMVKFQKKDNVNTMASCLLEFPNPQFKLQINETGVTIFPETVKNTILISIKFSKVLFFPFKVDFRAVKESDPYSLLISEFLFNKGFKVDNQINKIHKEKTKYAPVTNISLSKFNFINDISYEFDSNKKTANIKGEILCYYNEDPKTNQKMIIEYMKNLRNGTTEQFIKHQPIFLNKEELPIQIKPLEFKYLGSYLKIYGIKLIPVNSNYIKAQKEVVINISFNIDTAKFLEKKCEIKCKYGEEKFSIFYDEDEIKKAIKMFPKKKDNTQPINIVDVISTKNYNCNGKLVNYFSQTNETCIRYRGDKLVYLEKINKCIRRLNLIKYPNAVFLKSYLKFKCDDFTASLKIESDFPTCYDNSIITSNLVIKILNKSSGVDFLDLNRQRFEFMCKLLKTRFYNEHLTYPGRFKILLKSIINGFWALKGFMVSSCIYIKDYVLRRNKDTESHIVYDGFDKFALKISYTGPEVDYNSKIWYYLPKLSSNCTYDGQTLSSRLKISYGLFLDFLLARNACFTITICVDRTILLQERVAMNISNLGRWWTFRNLVFSF